MRVAFVSTVLGYPWGSPDRLWTDTAARYLRQGHEVFLALSPLTAAHESVQQLRSAGAQLFLRRTNSVYLGARDQLNRRLPFLRHRYLEPRLAAFRPEVVVITQGATYDALAEFHLLAWLEQSATPCVAICHNNQENASLSTDDRQLLRRFFNCATLTLFVSSRNREWAERDLEFTLRNTGLIQNPLAISSNAAIDWPIGDAPARLGLIGRLDIQHKGLDLLLAALASLATSHAFNLTLTGRCDDPAPLRNLVERHGLGDRTLIAPPVSGADLLRRYGELELFLLPSRYEGCASSMIEALMCGRSVLATPVGGVSDWIEEGVNGFVADAVTPEALRATLQRALDARSRWREMGAAARRMFDARRDPDPVLTLTRNIDHLLRPSSGRLDETHQSMV